MFVGLVGTDLIVVLNFLVIILGDCFKLSWMYKERRRTYVIYLKCECKFSYLCQICNKLTPTGVTSG